MPSAPSGTRRIHPSAVSTAFPHGSRPRVGARKSRASASGTFAAPPCSDTTHFAPAASAVRMHNSAIRPIAWQWMTSGFHCPSAAPSPGTNGFPPFRSSASATLFGIGHHG